MGLRTAGVHQLGGPYPVSVHSALGTRFLQPASTS